MRHWSDSNKRVAGKASVAASASEWRVVHSLALAASLFMKPLKVRLGIDGAGQVNNFG
jgi:hypothetical protein